MEAVLKPLLIGMLPFQSMSISATYQENVMENRGFANGISVSVRALHVYLIAHERRQKRIAEEKYGIESRGSEGIR